MWEEGRSAEQILEQIAAIRGALSSAGMEIVHAETKRRLQATPVTPDCPDGQDDILGLVDRLMRCR